MSRKVIITVALSGGGRTTNFYQKGQAASNEILVARGSHRTGIAVASGHTTGSQGHPRHSPVAGLSIIIEAGADANGE